MIHHFSHILHYVLALIVISTRARSIVAPVSSNPIIDLGYARYKGIRSDTTGVTTWFGLRYAVPPTTQHRWRPPLRIETYGYYDPHTVQDATSQGPSCVWGVPTWITGGVPLTAAVTGQEDCLTVDVLVPNRPMNKKLPVWIEIHGGGYTTGDAATMPGYAMVNQSQGQLIFVQVQYRLGAFGFLNNAVVRANGTANAGLLDQRLAMEWVQKYISKFGGDPTKVTIHGGSAGGGSVSSHLIMYGGVATPPFRAAIAEYPWWQPYHNETVLQYQYQDLLANTGCESLACLRLTSSTVLANAAQLTYGNGWYGDLGAHPATYGYGDFYYGPSIDGHILRALPSKEFSEGHFSRVPFLTNREFYEGFLFTNNSIMSASQTDSDLRRLWPGASEDFFRELYELYPVANYDSAFDRTQTIFGDAFINCGSWQMASAFAAANISSWKQIFNAGNQHHAATVPFLFGTSASGVVTEASNDTLAMIMKDWFISFASHLDPNAVSYSGVAKPTWSPYDACGSVMVSNQTLTYTGIDPDASKRCAFFKEHGTDIQN